MIGTDTTAKLNKIESTKAAISQAISDKGVDMSGVTVFGDYAGKITSIESGGKTVTLTNNFQSSASADAVQKDGKNIFINANDTKEIVAPSLVYFSGYSSRIEGTPTIDGENNYIVRSGGTSLSGWTLFCINNNGIIS